MAISLAPLIAARDHPEGHLARRVTLLLGERNASTPQEWCKSRRQGVDECPVYVDPGRSIVADECPLWADTAPTCVAGESPLALPLATFAAAICNGSSTSTPAVGVGGAPSREAPEGWRRREAYRIEVLDLRQARVEAWDALAVRRWRRPSSRPAAAHLPDGIVSYRRRAGPRSCLRSRRPPCRG